MCLCVMLCIVSYSLAGFITSSYLNVYLPIKLAHTTSFLMRQWRHICFPSKFDSWHTIGIVFWQLNRNYTLSMRIDTANSILNVWMSNKSFQRRIIPRAILSNIHSWNWKVECCCCYSPVDETHWITNNEHEYWIWYSRRSMVVSACELESCVIC